MVNTQFKHLSQVAIVVKDIEKSRTEWAKLLGVKETPINITQDWEATHMTFKGKPSKAKAKLTFFQFENITLELIEPVGKLSTWKQFGDKKGEGIHHIAFHVEDLDEALETFRKSEVDVEQQGNYKGGCYIYMNSVGKLGCTIELLHNCKE